MIEAPPSEGLGKITREDLERYLDDPKDAPEGLIPRITDFLRDTFGDDYRAESGGFRVENIPDETIRGMIFDHLQGMPEKRVEEEGGELVAHSQVEDRGFRWEETEDFDAIRRSSASKSGAKEKSIEPKNFRPSKSSSENISENAKFIRDAWEHPDTVVTYSFGSGGGESDTITFKIPEKEEEGRWVTFGVREFNDELLKQNLGKQLIKSPRFRGATSEQDEIAVLGQLRLIRVGAETFSGKTLTVEGRKSDEKSKSKEKRKPITFEVGLDRSKLTNEVSGIPQEFIKTLTENPSQVASLAFGVEGVGANSRIDGTVLKLKPGQGETEGKTIHLTLYSLLKYFSGIEARHAYNDPKKEIIGFQVVAKGEGGEDVVRWITPDSTEQDLKWVFGKVKFVGKDGQKVALPDTVELLMEFPKPPAESESLEINHVSASSTPVKPEKKAKEEKKKPISQPEKKQIEKTPPDYPFFLELNETELEKKVASEDQQQVRNLVRFWKEGKVESFGFKAKGDALEEVRIKLKEPLEDGGETEATVKAAVFRAVFSNVDKWEPEGASYPLGFVLTAQEGDKKPMKKYVGPKTNQELLETIVKRMRMDEVPLPDDIEIYIR